MWNDWSLVYTVEMERPKSLFTDSGKLISSHTCSKIKKKKKKSSWQSICSFYQYVSLVIQKGIVYCRFCSPSVKTDMPQDTSVCSSNWEARGSSAQPLLLKRRAWGDRNNEPRVVHWGSSKEGRSLSEQTIHSYQMSTGQSFTTNKTQTVLSCL